jgi:alanyl-tRNA synthetase
MNSNKLREKFLKFFEKKRHKIVPSSSLIPNDPSVLFTTAGMQQFKSYYLGEPSPYGKNVTSCQKCFRTSDIDEIGDERHLTFFEMLGNFSFGGYFKKEAIELAFEFLITECKLEIDNLWITIFKGEGNVPPDTESLKIWQKLDIKREKIFEFGKEDNFWGPTGKEGPCGPTTEIHYQVRREPCQKGKNCVPNCECARFIEIWNLVFNEYFQDEKGNLKPLKQKGVDTGMGLERLAMVVQKTPTVFETDLFFPIIEEIEKISLAPYNLKPKPYRIIADHIKGSVFLISEGVLPSNVERGYVLRRILRRAARYGKILNLPKHFLIALAKKVIEIYEDVYPELKSKEEKILTVIQQETEKFEKTLDLGLKRFDKISRKGNILGLDAFHLFDTFGFPLELTLELAKERNLKVDVEGFKKAFERHKEISRAGAEKKFGGIGKKADLEATKLHTATHLLHAALREILGKHVKQMGSDITSERLRFDFSHPRKLTEKEIREIEDLVNQKIKENLKIKKEEMSLKEALESGALSFFKEKYPERVTVYSIGDFSKEICAGPHVERTGQLGYFRIIKEESVGSGVRRIRAILEKFDKIKK